MTTRRSLAGVLRQVADNGRRSTCAVSLVIFVGSDALFHDGDTRVLFM